MFSVLGGNQFQLFNLLIFICIYHIIKNLQETVEDNDGVIRYLEAKTEEEKIETQNKTEEKEKDTKENHKIKANKNDVIR